MNKRLIDILGATIFILLLSPIFLIVSLLIFLLLGPPIFFAQDRPGLNEKIFKMYKFRTMTDEKDKDGYLLPDSERLTTFGKFLRSSSLDELPELYNVLKGDMSFVGPRPLLVRYLPLYTEEQKQRHNVRPGITGLAQINGRNAISWEDKFEFDIDYVKHQSLWLDAKILVKTMLVVLNRSGISSKSHATMTEFRGSKE